MRTWLVALSVAAAGLLATVAARAEDWPKWLGPRGDNIVTETGLADKWPEGGPKELWRAPVGLGFATPVAVKGKLYAFYWQDKKETLAALDAEKGTVLWQQSADPVAYRGNYPGTRATPTIEGERIYTYGIDGDLVCRDLADGKLVWQLPVLKEVGGKNIGWGQACSPAVYGDVIYVQAGGQGGPVVVGVNKATGKIAMKSESTVKGGHATVILIETNKARQLIVFAGTELLAVDPESGKTLWTLPWKTEWDVNATTPIFRDGHLFVTSGYRHGCMMVKPSAQGAEKLWEKTEPQGRFQPAILDKDLLFVNSEGTLMCLNWPDGAVKWSSKAVPLAVGGSILRAGDKLICLSESGKLSLVKATAEGAAVVSQMDLFQDRYIWSSPLVYQGRLYCKGANELVCLDIGAK